MEALIHKDRRRPNFKNRIDDTIEETVIEYAIERPAHDQASVASISVSVIEVQMELVY